MKPILHPENGVYAALGAPAWILNERRVITLDDKKVVPGEECTADERYVLDCMRVLEETERRKPAHEKNPIRLYVNTDASPASSLIALCEHMLTTPVPIYVLGANALNGAPLIIACGRPGCRFVSKRGFYKVALNELLPSMRERLDEFEKYGEASQEDSGDEISEDGTLRELPIASLVMLRDDVDCSNRIFLDMLADVCGERSKGLIDRLEELGSNGKPRSIILSADEMIGYGLADAILTKLNRHLFYG
jgi:hypothetical protein